MSTLDKTCAAVGITPGRVDEPAVSSLTDRALCTLLDELLAGSGSEEEMRLLKALSKELTRRVMRSLDEQRLERLLATAG